MASGAYPNGGAPRGGASFTHPAGRLAAPSILGPPAVLGAEIGAYGDIAVVSVFGDALILGGTWVRGRMALANALGVPAALAWHDYAAQLAGVSDFYLMELTGSPAVRIPIASWQATRQTGRSQYLQAVVPAAGAWVATITARQAAHAEMVIYRGTVLAGGRALTAEMARCPLQSVRYDRGATNYTGTLSGYAAAATDPAYATDTRTLRSIRLVSITNTIRVRCAIDWQLLPGMNVSAQGTVFKAVYVNYYVTGDDAYMDVGDRAA